MGSEIGGILFYDGDCGFCNSSVHYLMKRTQAALKFAPIGGSTFKQLYPSLDPPDSLIFSEGGDPSYFSDALLELNDYATSGLKTQLFLLNLIPRSIRNWGYTQIAKNRKRIPNKQCALPSPAERLRFLP